MTPPKKSYNAPKSKPFAKKPGSKSRDHGQSDDRDRPSKPRNFEDRPSKPRNFEDRPSKPRNFEDRPSKPRNFEDRPAMTKETDPKLSLGAGRLDEIKACGINACRAIFAKRRGDIVRVYVTEETKKEFSELLKWCAINRKSYHIVTDADMDKISSSTHHEGVCLIAKARKQASWDDCLETLTDSRAKAALFLILEDVGNPHNVGAIIRTAAHFQVDAILVPSKTTFKPSPALLRTAEGGSEFVDLITTPEMPVLAGQLRKAGISVLGTAANGKVDLYGTKELPKRMAIVIGNEARGLSPVTRKLVDDVIMIPGSGNIDSLNVSVATAVLLGECWRRRHPKGN